MRAGASTPTSRHVFARLVTAAAVVGATGCQATAPSPRSVTGSFDESGGTLELGDGAVSVVVPPGALARGAVLAIRDVLAEEVEPLASGAVARSGRFALTPHGTSFARPVEIAIRYFGEPEGLAVHRLDDEADPSWEVVAGVRFEGGVARFSAERLSILVVDGPALPPPCYADPACAGCVQVSGGVGTCALDEIPCSAGDRRLCVEETGISYAILCCPD